MSVDDCSAFAQLQLQLPLPIVPAMQVTTSNQSKGERGRWGGKGKVDEGDARFVKAAADHFKGEDGALRTGRVVASVESASARILAPTLVAWAAILCAEEPVADGGRAHRYALRCGAHGD